VKSSITIERFQKVQPHMHIRFRFCIQFNEMKHYLDDFIFSGIENSDQCKALMNYFLSISQELGIPITDEKIPVTVLTFLGLEIDTEDMAIRILQEKLESIKADLMFYSKPRLEQTPEKLCPLVYLIQSRSGAKKNEPIAPKNTPHNPLQQTRRYLGSLNFFGKAIRSARAFNRRFYDLTMKAKKSHHFIKLNAETKADMHMWLYFLDRTLNSLLRIPIFPAEF
jgi:hypothetical protein